MTHAFDFSLERVAAFMRQHLPGLRLTEDSVALGLTRDGELVAGVMFEGINRHNLWMHVAAEKGRKWLQRDYLLAVFAYAFLICGVDRISGYVDASNTDARRFNEHLGFREEARLIGAAADGGDVLLYVMWKEECRYLGRIDTEERF
jgi:RimJ/RimL family protein N-acetyltransferase